MTEKTVHEGNNVKRLREILRIKQDTLASELGLSQQAVSALEQKEALDKDMLEKIAAVLRVSPEAIKNFSEESVINVIQNNYEGATNNSNYNNQCTFNPLDKMVELYEALLKSEREKIDLLERMLEKK